jgi:hypothetical protein
MTCLVPTPTTAANLSFSMQTGTHTQSAPHFDPDLLKPVGLAPPSTAVQKAARDKRRKQLKSEIRLLELKRSNYDREIDALQAQLDAA